MRQDLFPPEFSEKFYYFGSGLGTCDLKKSRKDFALGPPYVAVGSDFRNFLGCFTFMREKMKRAIFHQIGGVESSCLQGFFTLSQGSKK